MTSLSHAPDRPATPGGDPPAGLWSPGRRVWLAVSLVVLVLVTYRGSLPVPLSSDARFLTYQNELVRSGDGILRFWTRDAFEGAETHGVTYRSGYYRPVLNAFFWLEYRWAGARDGLYNVSEVLLHGLNAFLVALLVAGLAGSGTAGLVAGVLFAVHPVNAFAATEPAARGDVLFTAFYLGALLLFRRALVGHRRLSVGVAASVGALYLLSLLSKEMGVTLPAVLVLLALLAYARGGTPPFRWRWTLPAWGLLAAYLLWRFVILRLEPGSMGYGDSHGRFALLLATLSTLPVHAARLLVPVGPGFPELDPELVVVVGQGLVSPLTWTALGLLALLVVVMAGWRRRPEPAFWAAFFLVTWSPLLRVDNIGGTLDTSVILTQERWIYLPAVAFFAVVGMAAVRLERTLTRRWVVPVSVATLASLLAWEGAVHAGKHEDPFARLRRLYAIPEQYLGRFELANRALLYANWVSLPSGDLEDAESRGRAALELVPDSPITAHGLAAILARRGAWREVRDLLAPWMYPDPAFLAESRATNFRVYDDWNRINPEVALLLGRAVGHLGDAERARALLCDALARGMASERVESAAGEVPSLAGGLTCSGG